VFCKVCLISPGTDLPGEWALLALGSFPGLLRQTLVVFNVGQFARSICTLSYEEDEGVGG